MNKKYIPQTLHLQNKKKNQLLLCCLVLLLYRPARYRQLGFHLRLLPLVIVCYSILNTTAVLRSHFPLRLRLWLSCCQFGRHTAAASAMTSVPEDYQNQVGTEAGKMCIACMLALFRGLWLAAKWRGASRISLVCMIYDMYVMDVYYIEASVEEYTLRRLCGL